MVTNPNEILNLSLSHVDRLERCSTDCFFLKVLYTMELRSHFSQPETTTVCESMPAPGLPSAQLQKQHTNKGKT